MTRFNFNAIPVLDNQQLVGIITRQVVEKAAHHKLQRLSISEVMNTDFETVKPESSLAELQRGILEHNQRCIPVLEKDQLVGIVTRTDLLRYLAGEQRGFEDKLPVEAGPGGMRLKRKNLARLLDSQLPKYIRELLHQLGEVADRQGVRIYLVGGFVRDLLMRQENYDIDVVVEGDGIAFAEAFAATVSCRVRSHEKFCTAVIVLPDDFKIDIASARLEYYEKPAALPHVEHSSIRHDLYRRDFSINTLTIGLNQDNYGELLDFFGGQRDIKDKSIRVLHNLSLIEDPTRLFRAVRFEQRLGFRIGQQTERLMRSAVRMKLVKKVGGARILSELRQILDEPQVISALRRLEQFDLLKFIDPYLRFDQKVANMIVAAEKTSSWFDLLYTGERYHRWLVYLSCLFSSLSEKGLKRVSLWLDLQPKYRDLLLQQLPQGKRALKTAHYRAGMTEVPENSEIFHWFNGMSLELLLFLMAGTENERVRKWISQYITTFRKVRVLLDGKGLIALGMQPGPHFHDVFLALLDARLNGQVRTLEDEKQLVQNNFKDYLAAAAGR